ncbi:MAG: hypothetical protein HQ510_07685 [Candidatus Marinimicrobia bacterium]|nr:hypothetical protein [Candidatus Neomarinimicrobiota bacterium]
MNKLILTAISIGIHLLFFTNSYAGSLDPTADKILFLQEIQDSTNQQLTNTDMVHREFKFAGKAMILSGLVPGLGEYYTGEWKRGLIFAGIEVTSWLFWSKYNRKGDDAEKVYERYADEHWSFSTWVADYYQWDDDDDPYKFLFSKVVGDSAYVYEDIWGGSHSMDFYYTHYVSGQDPQVKLMSTNSDEFNDYFQNNFENMSADSISNLIALDENFHVIQDGAYYENVGKYNGFFAGWDDNDSISVYSKTGYDVAKSPNKWTYRQMRQDSNDYKKIANYMMSTIMLNHVASMIDAVITTKKWNDNVTANLSAQTKFDPREKYGIGGVQIDLTLDW